MGRSLWLLLLAGVFAGEGLAWTPSQQLGLRSPPRRHVARMGKVGGGGATVIKPPARQLAPPDTDRKTGAGGGAKFRILLFNDPVNTKEYVARILMTKCGVNEGGLNLLLPRAHLGACRAETVAWAAIALPTDIFLRRAPGSRSPLELHQCSLCRSSDGRSSISMHDASAQTRDGLGRNLASRSSRALYKAAHRGGVDGQHGPRRMMRGPADLESGKIVRKVVRCLSLRQRESGAQDQNSDREC